MATRSTRTRSTRTNPGRPDTHPSRSRTESDDHSVTIYNPRIRDRYERDATRNQPNRKGGDRT